MEALQFYSEIEGGGFDEARKASCESISTGREEAIYGVDIAQTKSVLQCGLEGEEEANRTQEKESYGRGSFSEIVQRKSVEQASYADRFSVDEGGVSLQMKGMDGESHISSKFLLSGSMVSARGKKKRRSRAASKAPIKVFSADTSNFMAMVHKLTGIPCNTFPLHGTHLPPDSSKLLPFIQGLPTLDTSAMLLPPWACDRSSSGFSCLQSSSSQQEFVSLSLDTIPVNQASQLSTDANINGLSYSDLMRSMCSTNHSSLPNLWEPLQVKPKSLVDKPQESAFSERPKVSQEDVPASSLSRLEILFGSHEARASTDAWISNTGVLASKIPKKELA